MNWMFIGIVGAAVAIYAMVDISLRRYPLDKKVLWFPIVIVLPFIGPALYFAFKKNIPVR